MAFTNSLTFLQNQDIESGVVTDATDYGVSGNPLRNAKSNYLLWSKTDKNGVRTFYNPDQEDVSTNLTYDVDTATDGHYEGILMRFGNYNGAIAYVEQQMSGSTITQYASIVYYNGVVYKATAPGTGNLPTDTNFWEPVTDLSTLIANTNVDVYIEDFYIKVRASQCVNSKFEDMDKCGCNGSDMYALRGALQLKAMLLSADLAFADDNAALMEKIISEINATCSEC